MLRGTGVAGTAVITGGTIKLDDGTKAAPSYSFTNATGLGMYQRSAVAITFTCNNLDALDIQQGTLTIPSGSMLGFSSTTQASGAQDTVLARGSAGVFKFASANSFSANGSVATTMTSLGPTGSHTTIQTWLTIQDSTGAVRYIPCY
jgi:hypothetical protein